MFKILLAFLLILEIVLIQSPAFVLVYPHRYLDNVVNRQSISPPIPHLHALLTSGDEPPLEVDIFELIKTSYEVRGKINIYLSDLCHLRSSPAFLVQPRLIGFTRGLSTLTRGLMLW